MLVRAALPCDTAALVNELLAGWRCPVNFAVLAVVVLAGLVGPLLAYPRGWHVPVVLGELLMGILLGTTGVGYLDASDPTFTFLAEVGFGLVMFLAGAHVPVLDVDLRRSLGRGIARVALVAAGSAVLGVVLAAVFGTGNAALYAVLMASSSALLILPIISSLDLGGPQVLALLPQVAIADAACIVALPLVIDPVHVGRAALGALAVILIGAALFAVLLVLERRGYRRRLHDVVGGAELRPRAADQPVDAVPARGRRQLVTGVRSCWRASPSGSRWGPSESRGSDSPASCSG